MVLNEDPRVSTWAEEMAGEEEEEERTILEFACDIYMALCER
ncbi:hypothetical protein N9L68_03205 [bacterium]|nr:hypothetical protein [bacterium]